MNDRPPSRAQTRVFAVLTLLLLFGLQETLARFLFPLPEAEAFDRVSYSPMKHLDVVDSLAHTSFEWASEPDGQSFVHRLNLYGFTDETWRLEKDPKTHRVMFVGDSYVEGLMAPFEASIPRRFEALAASDGESVEAMNLGIAGANLGVYERLLNDAPPIFQPDEVVLVLYANDLPARELQPERIEEIRGVPARKARRRSVLRPRLFDAALRVFAGRTTPRRWHAPPFSFLAATPSPVNPWSTPKKASYYEQFVDPDLADAMRRGRFNPFSINRHGVMQNKLAEAIDPMPLLELLRDRTDPARLSVVYFPARHQVSDAYLEFAAKTSREKSPASLTGEEFQTHAHALSEACERLDLPFLDLTPTLREEEAAGRRLYWNYDSHPTAEGYDLAAREIFRWWKEN